MIRFIKKLIQNYKVRAGLLFALSIAIFISLFSYNAGDPSFNSVTDNDPSNLMSLFGSCLADIIFQFFGLAGYIIPICFFVWSWRLFTNGCINMPLLKLIFMLLSIVCAGGIFYYYPMLYPPLEAGGLAGMGFVYLLKDIKYAVPYGNYLPLIITSIATLSFIMAVGIKFSACGRNILIFFYYIGRITGKIIPFNKIADYRDNKAYRESAEIDHIGIGQRDKGHSGPAVVPPVKVLSTEAGATKAGSITTMRGGNDVLPDIELLADGNNQNFQPQTKEELTRRSEELIAVLADFGVKGKIINVREGPVVTLYEFEPAAGTKSSRVIGLADDIARSLCAVSTRISVIPGRNALGIELPNHQRMFFRLKELVTTEQFQDRSISLPLILGKDLGGAPMIADLAKMPHLLVAGTTGSGKSVAINAMIMSLLYRYRPEECRMIMIDPKMLELSAYDGIPHLMTPVVTESGKAVVALKWAVKEMENRYRLMSNFGVRSIANYNIKIEECIKKGEKPERKIQTGFDPETGKPIYDSVSIDMIKMPFIVVIVDEMADLMLVAGKDIETSIQRLAQMARAAGIHIIMATQRPSVDVITGVIKANFPSRISFKVTSKIDSRTILGEQGAEQLLGMGDMLYMGNSSRILRVHGPFVDDSEVEKVTDFLRSTGTPEYISAVTESTDDEFIVDNMMQGSGDSDLYTQALNIVRTERKSSISYIQRSLRIGYNRAATLVDELEKNGVLSAPNHSGKREVLLPED